MRRRNFLVMMACACMGLLLTLGSVTAGFAGDKPKVIELSYSTFFPITHSQGMLSQMFCDEINKRTDGRVKITLFPGGTLLSATKIYDGVKRGITDIGWAVPTYTPGRFEFSNALSMPRTSRSAWVTGHVAADAFKHYNPKAYDDVHLLLACACPPYAIGTFDKPVRKPEDLKGVKIRAGGSVASSFAKALGAVPQAMPMSEAYEAMAKGVIQALLTPVETQKGWKHADVTKYLTILPISFSTDDLVIMNKRKWNSLPKDIQEIFTEVSSEFEEFHRRAWWYSSIEALAYFEAMGKGRTVIVIPESEIPEWENYLKPLKENFLKTAKEKGLPGEEWLLYLDERAEHWNKNHLKEEVAETWAKENKLAE